LDDDAAHEGNELIGAAIVGMLAGAGIALLLRRRHGKRYGTRAIVRRAGKNALRYGRRGAKHMAHRTASALDRLPIEEIGESLGDRLAAAREAIDEVVAEEVKDLRKAIRRQRKRLGV